MAKRMSLLLSYTNKQSSDNYCVLYYFPAINAMLKIQGGTNKPYVSLSNDSFD